MVTSPKTMTAILQGALSVHPKNEERAVTAAAREYIRHPEMKEYLEESGKEKIRAMLEKLRKAA